MILGILLGYCVIFRALGVFGIEGPFILGFPVFKAATTAECLPMCHGFLCELYCNIFGNLGLLKIFKDFVRFDKIVSAGGPRLWLICAYAIVFATLIAIVIVSVKRGGVQRWNKLLTSYIVGAFSGVLYLWVIEAIWIGSLWWREILLNHGDMLMPIVLHFWVKSHQLPNQPARQHID